MADYRLATPPLRRISYPHPGSLVESATSIAGLQDDP
ncbi:hypothetical protein RAM_03915 [Amycolatopsis mediterranei S699]|uniref:Uncharacterized protein n=1 Tax=Amycolatopsis mediterranei (strain S699) TaxID=713604 RepID=A0A9R0NRF9_AMYMS|nr:hypothetical protein RAM_03915 [Amycolatopsis mediterranei S699]